MSEITSTEPDDELHTIDMTPDEEAFEKAEDYEEDDPEKWDAFRDAHKFEMLNQQKEKVRLSML